MVYSSPIGYVVSEYDLAVVGGGWAGLAASTEAAKRGLKVVLLERRRGLGGRTYSFRSDTFNEWLDNGQHLFIGAYHAARSLLETWGSAHHLRFDYGDRIAWLERNGRVRWLKISKTRNSLKTGLSILGFGGLRLIDRIRTAKATYNLLQFKVTENTEEPSLSIFLQGFGIEPGGCSGLWEAISRSVLNCSADKAGVISLANAFREGLFVGGKTAQFGIPDQPFKTLVSDPARDYLSSKGVRIICKTTVKAVQPVRDGISISVDGDSEDSFVRSVVIAVPPVELLRMLPVEIRQMEFFNRFSNYEFASIACVHIDYDRPVLRHRFAFMPDSIAQWVFGRGEGNDTGWSKISVVTSQATSRGELPTFDLIELIKSELSGRIPDINKAQIRAVQAIRTSRATVLLSPGVYRIRPTVQTPVKNLFLAGDWVNTGLPATIESAARSGLEAGRLAADNA